MTDIKKKHEDEDDGEIQALRLAALQSLLQKRKVAVNPIPQPNPVVNNSQYHNTFPGRGFRGGHRGRNGRNASFRQHHINTNLISIIPIPESVPSLNIEGPSDDSKNSPPKLNLPQNRYHKAACQTEETKESENPTASSKFSRFEDSNSDSEESDEEIFKTCKSYKNDLNENTIEQTETQEKEEIDEDFIRMEVESDYEDLEELIDNLEKDVDTKKVEGLKNEDNVKDDVDDNKHIENNSTSHLSPKHKNFKNSMEDDEKPKPKSRSKSRSRSNSRPRSYLKSPKINDRSSRSPYRKRLSPNYKVPSPTRKRRHSPKWVSSPPRKRSVSPFTRRLLSPTRHHSPSPRRRSPSPRRRSPSPRRRSPSPRRTPLRRRSPSSLRRFSPRRRTPSPIRRRSPSPLRRSPVLRRITPPRRRSPSPLSRRYSPLRRRTPSPLQRNASPPMYRSRGVSPPRRNPSPPRRTRFTPSPRRRISSPWTPSSQIQNPPRYFGRRSRSPQRISNNLHSPSRRPLQDSQNLSKRAGPSNHHVSPRLSLSPEITNQDSSSKRIKLSPRSNNNRDKRDNTPKKKSKKKEMHNHSSKRKKDKKSEKKESKVKNTVETQMDTRRKKFQTKETVEPSSKKIKLNVSNNHESKSNEEKDDLDLLEIENEVNLWSDDESDSDQDSRFKSGNVKNPKEKNIISLSKLTKTANPKEDKSLESDTKKESPKKTKTDKSDTKDLKVKVSTIQQTNEKNDEKIESKLNSQSNKLEDKDNGDLRMELSRRRAERLTKAGSVHESLPARLLQSAFQGVVGMKTFKKLEKEEKSKIKDSKAEKVEGRRILILKRPTSSVSESKEIRNSNNRPPVHLRLGIPSNAEPSSQIISSSVESVGQNNLTLRSRRKGRKVKLNRHHTLTSNQV